jgi:hypothetical protein
MKIVATNRAVHLWLISHRAKHFPKKALQFAHCELGGVSPQHPLSHENLLLQQRGASCRGRSFLRASCRLTFPERLLALLQIQIAPCLHQNSLPLAFPHPLEFSFRDFDFPRQTIHSGLRSISFRSSLVPFGQRLIALPRHFEVTLCQLVDRHGRAHTLDSICVRHACEACRFTARRAGCYPERSCR